MQWAKSYIVAWPIAAAMAYLVTPMARRFTDRVIDRSRRRLMLSALALPAPSNPVETLLTTGLVVVAGEVTTAAYAPVAQLVRQKILEIGYDSSEKGFDGNSCGVMVAIGAQSADIAQGVDDASRSASVVPATSSTARARATRA